MPHFPLHTCHIVCTIYGGPTVAYRGRRARYPFCPPPPVALVSSLVYGILRRWYGAPFVARRLTFYLSRVLAGRLCRRHTLPSWLIHSQFSALFLHLPATPHSRWRGATYPTTLALRAGSWAYRIPDGRRCYLLPLRANRRATHLNRLPYAFTVLRFPYMHLPAVAPLRCAACPFVPTFYCDSGAWVDGWSLHAFGLYFVHWSILFLLG